MDKPPSSVDAPAIEAVRSRMAHALKRHLAGAIEKATPVPGLTIHGLTSPLGTASYLYEPAFAFIARGAKRVVLGDETYVYDESHFLLTAVGLPTIVEVRDASESRPYYSVKLDIDLDLAHDLISEVDRARPAASPFGTGMAIGPVTYALASSVMRLVDLLDAPEDVPILARSLQREILYRVLTSEVGGRLRQAVQVGTQTQRVSIAIRHLREHMKEPIRIEELARVAHMGESTLHHHFRALTAMSPLQYQKQLRLHEARRLMITERLNAASAAYRVGYESATQFNREYRRMFGVPPKSDIRRVLSHGRTSA